MNCKRCNSPITENDQFCKSCGAAVNETTVPNVNLGDNGNIYSGQAQQPINQQPVWANSYNQQPTYNQIAPKNNGNTKFIIIGIIAAIAIFAGIMIASMSNSDDNNLLNGGTSNSGVTNTGNSTNTQQVNNSSYKVNFKGFTFNIPDDLIYEEDSGVLMIGDEEGTWVAQIEIEEGSFAQIKANKSQLQSMMQQSGYTSSIAQEKTLGGVDFITLEISYGGQNAIAALTKANSMYFMGVTAMNLDNEFDYSLLETIAPIISSVSYSGTTTNMEIGTKLDMNKIAEIAK